MSEGIKTIAFDVDGVLVDSRPLLRDYYCRILEEAGFSPPESVDDLVRCFHMGKRDALQYLSGTDDLTEINNLLEISKKTPRDISLLIFDDELEDTLHRLREKMNLAIVSNADDETPEEVFRRKPRIRQLFGGVVITATNGKALKPNPAMLLEAMRQLSAKPNETAFAGDSETDIRAGKAAGVTTIQVVRSGEEFVTDPKPDIKTYNLQELYVAAISLYKANGTMRNGV